ncbi:MAG: tetratricopeptide repeat protein, partial [Acidobacteriota bacterium]
REAHLARRALRLSQRRRRLATAVAGFALLTLALVLVFAVRERKARTVASREAQTSQQVTDFLVELFGAADPFGAPGDTLTVREVLDRGTERIRDELSDEPGVQSTLMHTMGDVYRSLGQFAVAIPLLEEAIETRRASLGDGHPLVAQSLHTLGEAQCRGGQFEAGEGSLEASLEIRRDLDDSELEMGETLESLGHLCLQFRGDLVRRGGP